MEKKKLPKIVVVGGGTGTFVALSGLKRHPVELVAVVSMADSGGSNRIIRDEFGLLPTSDIRQCMVALAETNGESKLLRELFMYRFHKGRGIAGMTFGNLFIAALADIEGSQEKAIEDTGRILRIKGQILPVTTDDVNLVAVYEDGSRVVGEHEIDEPEHDGRLRITKLSTKPAARVAPHAARAIRDANLIVLGPGDLYTSVLADVVVGGLAEAIRKSRGKVVYVVNLMTRWGQTYEFTALDHVREIEKYLGEKILDAVVLNSNFDFPNHVLRAYKKEHAKPVEDDLSGNRYRVFRRNLLSSTLYKKARGDKLTRSVIRHDPEKLGETLLSIVRQ
ncbi:YvcK family protein [Patescibacteria group bacterium]|nr:YvcK family protein [Patescibacteria group bacterium]